VKFFFKLLSPSWVLPLLKFFPPGMSAPVLLSGCCLLPDLFSFPLAPPLKEIGYFPPCLLLLSPSLPLSLLIFPPLSIGLSQNPSPYPQWLHEVPHFDAGFLSLGRRRKFPF